MHKGGSSFHPLNLADGTREGRCSNLNLLSRETRLVNKTSGSAKQAREDTSNVPKRSATPSTDVWGSILVSSRGFLHLSGRTSQSPFVPLLFAVAAVG